MIETPKLSIRWLIRRDMDEVLSIENRCFQFPWTEEEFLITLRKRNCIGVVAEDQEDRVLGFMLYELYKDKLRILNFAVDPDNWRTGIGRQLCERLIDKLSQQRRKRISVEVRESNTKSHLFFQSMRFKAINVWRNHYRENNEDAYLFQYSLGEVE
jgi:[ribosomal protein S18]-alanine N-acetyltransferase